MEVRRPISMRECIVHRSPCHLPRRDPQLLLWVSGSCFYCSNPSSLQWVCANRGERLGYFTAQKNRSFPPGNSSERRTNPFWKLLYGHIWRSCHFWKMRLVWESGLPAHCLQPLSLPALRCTSSACPKTSWSSCHWQKRRVWQFSRLRASKLSDLLN